MRDSVNAEDLASVKRAHQNLESQATPQTSHEASSTQTQLPIAASTDVQSPAQQSNSQQDHTVSSARTEPHEPVSSPVNALENGRLETAETNGPTSRGPPQSEAQISPAQPAKGGMNWSAVAAQAASIPQRKSRNNLQGDSPTKGKSPTRSKNKRNTQSPRSMSSNSLKQEGNLEVSSRSAEAEDASQRPSKPLHSAQTSLIGTNQRSINSIEVQRDQILVGGCEWRNLSLEEVDRLSMVRGFENRTGSNNCFLNVVIQCLWHTRPFREAFLKLSPQEAAKKGGSPSDLGVLNALHSIFTELEKSCSSGEIIDAKRMKLDGQNDAANVASPVLCLSPIELRRALDKADKGIGLSSMQDASELTYIILECLHKAEAGKDAQSLDSSLPQQVQIPAEGSPKQADDFRQAQYGPGSIVRTIFAQEIQIPDKVSQRERAGKDGEVQQQAKRSKGTGGAVVDRWQDVPSRSQKTQQPPPAQPLPKLSTVGKPKDVLDVFQYIQLLIQVPAQEYVASPKAMDVKLLNRPNVFLQALGWESVHVSTKVLEGLVGRIRPVVDLSMFYEAASKATQSFTIQALICFYGNHYVAFVFSFEIDAWLQLNDSTICKVGTWGDVLKALMEGHLQPQLMFYHQN